MPKPSLISDELLEEVEAIKQAVAHAFGIAVADLEKRNQTRIVTIPRQIALYLTKQRTAATLTEIGKCFSLHHTSVLHSTAKIDELRRISPEAHKVIETLSAALKREGT